MEAALDSPKLWTYSAGAVALAGLMPFIVLELFSLFLPEIGPDARLYIGLACLIASYVAIALGYDRYRRWRIHKSDGMSNFWRG
jgi:hypothetical protein